MRILDENNNEIQNPDYEKGYLKEERIFIKHHEAVKEVKEQGHWETIAEYENGGKDVEWIIDVPGIKPKEAYDEYEGILRYVLYTPEELAEIEKTKNRPTEAERIAELEEALNMLLSGVTK